MPRIAIIGAGVSTAALAHYLDPAIDIEIFEKARGPGGRMAHRRLDEGHFDHGAQFFTARGEAFREFLAPLVQAGEVAEWNPRVTTLEKGCKPYQRIWFEPHYVGVPGMNQLVKSRLRRSRLHFGTRVSAMQVRDQRWQLSLDDGGPSPAFDWVISTAPAPQSRALLPADFADAAVLDSAIMQGCYTLMLKLDESFSAAWDAAVVKNSPIGWLAMNTSKPARPALPALVGHTTNEWAEQHIDDDPGQVESILKDEVRQLLALPADRIEHSSLHRWRYANVCRAGGKPFCIDPEMRLAACGDWCIDGRVEAAFDSARQLAMHLNEHLSTARS